MADWLQEAEATANQLPDSDDPDNLKVTIQHVGYGVLSALIDIGHSLRVLSQRGN
jgi:hypothetical protein